MELQIKILNALNKESGLKIKNDEYSKELIVIYRFSVKKVKWIKIGNFHIKELNQALRALNAI